MTPEKARRIIAIGEFAVKAIFGLLIATMALCLLFMFVTDPKKFVLVFGTMGLIAFAYWRFLNWWVGLEDVARGIKPSAPPPHWVRFPKFWDSKERADFIKNYYNQKP